MALAALVLAVFFFPPSLARADEMRFSVVDLGVAGCKNACPQAIAADGVIEPETPQAFIDFVKHAARSPRLSAIVLLNSPGGNVVASMELGSIFRTLKVAAIVRQVGARPGRGDLSFTGQCISACVYAMMGGVKRVAPPGSRVGLHRMSIVERGFFTTTRSLADPPLVAALSKYARKIGVDQGLVTAA